MKQLLAAVVLSACGFTPAAAEAAQGTLYKQQQCECCEAHADYLRHNGFELKIEAVRNLSQISLDAGVPRGFQGCHLIKINGYVFEGHVTSDIIKKVLHDKPDLVGLSIKGCPLAYREWMARRRVRSTCMVLRGMDRPSSTRPSSQQKRNYRCRFCGCSQCHARTAGNASTSARGPRRPKSANPATKMLSLAALTAAPPMPTGVRRCSALLLICLPPKRRPRVSPRAGFRGWVAL